MPRDCTDNAVSSRCTVQVVTCIQYMTKLTKRDSATVKQLRSELAALKIARKKKSTPFRDVGGILGKQAAALTGMKSLQGVGKWLGSGIGSIFGSGDYTVMGPTPGYNVLAGQTPKFSTSHATNIISHREYLGDITGAAAFSNRVYPLNPGMATTFPWLSTIAANYQQYKFHGLIFEFRPLITDFVTSGAPGVIVMTTNYNADQNEFGTRQEAENAEFAVSVKPTQGLMHMIECRDVEVANKLYNVRTIQPPAGQDLRLYDYGKTQIITQNNPAQVLGELWVSYCVEFFKPCLSVSNDVIVADGFLAFRTAGTTGSPLGSIGVRTSGSLSTVVTSSTITVTNAVIGVRYEILVSWQGATSVIAVGQTGTSGVSPVNVYGSTPTSFLLSGNTSSACTLMHSWMATSTTMVITVNATITGTPTVDLAINACDLAIVV